MFSLLYTIHTFILLYILHIIRGKEKKETSRAEEKFCSSSSPPTPSVK